VQNVETGRQLRSCITQSLIIHGNQREDTVLKDIDPTDHLYVYGSDRELLLELVKENSVLGEKLHSKMNYLKAEVVWAVRHEMARTVEDVLARRSGVLFLDARVAIEMAPIVAALIAKELNKDETWERNQVTEFINLGKGYLVS